MTTDRPTAHQEPPHPPSLDPRRRRQKVRFPHRRIRELESGPWPAATTQGLASEEHAE